MASEQGCKTDDRDQQQPQSNNHQHSNGNTNGHTPTPPIVTNNNHNHHKHQFNNFVQDEWEIKISPNALQTENPIRKIVETLRLEPNKDKPFIPLSIGDPTLFENFKPCTEIIDAVLKSVRSLKFNGYQPAAGGERARQAVADYCSAYGMNVKSKDVILSSGCSHALDLAMAVFAVPGGNILVPKPGFPLYKTLSTMLRVEIKYYNLLPEQNWQIDLEDLDSKIDDNTSAIIYNNPSNPCGSVFTKQHILDFLAVAQKHRIPVIADEIYEDLVFPGSEFHALASLTNEVPVLHCSGTTKKFLIPGWRLGWIVINDRKERFGPKVRSALNSLSQRIIGSNSLIQGALPDMLQNTPKCFFEETISCISKNATLAYSRLKLINGLTPIKPSGAFYIMVRIDTDRFPAFTSDLHFVESLVAEESVFCLPGACFEYPGYVRLVLAISYEVLEEAFNRIEQFCNKYYV